MFNSTSKNNSIALFSNRNFLLQIFWVKPNLKIKIFFNNSTVFNLFTIKKNNYFSSNLYLCTYNYNNLNAKFFWNLYKPLFFFFLLKNLNHCVYVLYFVNFINFFDQLIFYKKIDLPRKIFFFNQNLKTL